MNGKKTVWEIIKFVLISCIVSVIQLVLFSTWLQGVVANWALSSSAGFIAGLAPTLAAMAAGSVQMLVLFPLEKFVLFKKRGQ